MKRLKIIAGIFVLSLTAANCSLTAKSSRETASLRTGLGKSLTSRQQQAQKKFVRDIKSGKYVVGKAIMLHKNKALCIEDLRNQQRLAPPFARAAPARHKSSVAFKKNIACSQKDKDKLAFNSQRFVPSGEQMAALPLAPLLIGGGVAASTGLLACLAAKLDDRVKEYNIQFPNERRSDPMGWIFTMIPMVTSPVLAAGGAVEAGAAALSGWLIGAGALGLSIASGFVGYLVCQGGDDAVVYTIEEQ